MPLNAVPVDYTMHFKRNFGLDLRACLDDHTLTLATIFKRMSSRLPSNSTT